MKQKKIMIRASKINMGRYATDADAASYRALLAERISARHPDYIVEVVDQDYVSVRDLVTGINVDDAVLEAVRGMIHDVWNEWVDLVNAADAAEFI